MLIEFFIQQKTFGRKYTYQYANNKRFNHLFLLNLDIANLIVPNRP